MKKSIFKRFAAIAACATVCAANMATVSAYADYSADSSDLKLEIVSSAAPDSIVEYGRNIFGTIQEEDLGNLEIDYDSLSDLKLCQPFQTFDDDGSDEYNVYYFPVLSDKDITAVLTVTENTEDGTLSYQFGKDEMALALNEVSSESNTPIEIHVNDDCLYSVSGDTADIMYVFDDNADDITVSATSNIASVVRRNLPDLDTVEISAENAYSDSVASITVSYSGKQRPVVYVSNYNNNTSWASCVGALCTYYTNPSTGGSSTDASNVRYAAISKYGSTGGVSIAKSAIEYYSGVTMVSYGSTLSFTDVKTQILTNNSPFYSNWTSSSASDHAMVVSGYRYNSSDPNNSLYYGIYTMDPNSGTNTLISYGGTYTVYGNTYSWTSSIYKY